MGRAVEGLEILRKRAEKVGIVGNREYNPGWHTALDLANLLDCSEAIVRSALERKESRGGHFREDYTSKEAAYGSFNLLCKKGPDGRLQIRREPIPEMRSDLKQVVEENK
jgi:succinate dehydrogenase / fumarate reductase flavoprotein subunit